MRRIANIRCMIRHARVLVYSTNADVRTRVKQALGRMPDSSSSPVDFVDFATHPAVIREMAFGKIDLVIADGEASPSGGMGLAKQLKDELAQCPPIVVITARSDDAWLADWSGADAVVSRELDPIAVKDAVAPLLREGLTA
jgi:DNA-binding NarL/FixJ family response regulator